LHVITIAITIHQEDQQTMKELALKINRLEDAVTQLTEERLENKFYKLFGDVASIVLSIVRKKMMSKQKLDISSAMEELFDYQLNKTETEQPSEKILALQALARRVQEEMHFDFLFAFRLNTARCLAVHGGLQDMSKEDRVKYFQKIRNTILEKHIPQEYKQHTSDLLAMVAVAEKKMICSEMNK